MDILKTFLKLTKKTYPYRTEEQLAYMLPFGYETDRYGNYFYKIGNSKSVFTCHLDTACKAEQDITHVIEGSIVKTDGKTILGADDKAGMTILLWMIHNQIPGLYYFFIGEEVGCIGSSSASYDEQFFSQYDRMISFDRRGTGSVITHQTSRRTCSNEFGKALVAQFKSAGLKMHLDDGGIYTDSAEFVDSISECTNISVGYYNEHTTREYQDISHLIKLCHAVTKVDFESLPSVRDKSQIEYKAYKYDAWNHEPKKVKSSTNWSWNYGDDPYQDEYYSRRTKRNRSRRGKSSIPSGSYSLQDEKLRYGYTDPQTNYYFVDGRKVEMKKRQPKISNSNQDHQTDYYVFLRDMYLEGNLTKEELNTIKNNLVHNSNEISKDKDLLNYLIESL